MLQYCLFAIGLNADRDTRRRQYIGYLHIARPFLVASLLLFHTTVSFVMVGDLFLVLAYLPV